MWSVRNATLELAGLERVAVAGAAVPGGAMASELGVRGAWPWLALLVASRWMTADRVRGRQAARRGAWMLVCLLWAPAGLAWARRDRGREGRLSLLFLDVGQGLSVLLTTPDHLMVYDTGPGNGLQGEAGLDMVGGTIQPMIRATGRKPDLVIVSHGDLDHAGGLTGLMSEFPGAEYLANLRENRPDLIDPNVF